MSLLGSIGNFAFRNLVAPIAQSAIRAVAPGATDLLKSVLGTGFDIAKFGARVALPLMLPGPIGMLAGLLLGPTVGKGFDALKNMTTNGIENFVRQVVSQPQDRELYNSPYGNQITLPPLSQTAQSWGASTASGGGLMESIGNGISNFFGSGGGAEDQIANMAGNLTEPPVPGKDASEGEMLKYQAALQKYARLMDMYSKIIQAHHDMKKGIIANFRV